jgi:RNA polymerase sigma-70 factor (ECF subfamily)
VRDQLDDLTRLALAARCGDQAALTRLVQATQPHVWRMCAHLLDRASADDMTQETYVRAFRALPAFRADASVMTWLLSIARRVVADEVSQRTRGRRLTTALESESGRHHGHLAAVTESVELADALDRLDSDRRTAFVLTQLLGLSYAEAAKVCDCPVGTIRSRVSRARTDLLGQWRADEPLRVQGT